MKKKRLTCFLLSFIIVFSSFVFVSEGTVFAVNNEKYYEAEKAILQAWDNQEDELSILDYCISVDDFDEFKNYVEYNNTEYFYVEISSKCTYEEKTNFIYRLTFTYHFTRDEVRVMKKEFDAKCDEILNTIPEDISVEEKLLFVHDYIASFTTYDKSVYEGATSADKKYIYNAYGCLVKGKAVCEGISEAFMYLCKRLGIECYLVTSEAMHHEWNMVRIGDNYYHIDITQDAPVYNLGKHGFHQAPGDITHKFFLLSDTEIKNEELGNSVHYSWNAPFKATDSTTYSKAFWKGVESIISYVDGSYYYIHKGELVRYKYKTNQSTVVCQISDGKWSCSCNKEHIWRSGYSKATMGKDSQVYFIYANSVFAYCTKSKQLNLVYSRNEQGFIYSIMYKNNSLYIAARNDEEHYGEVHYFYYDIVVPVSSLVGDCDGNGHLDVADALRLQRYINKEESVVGTKSDINNDSEINNEDLALLKTKILSK